MRNLVMGLAVCGVLLCAGSDAWGGQDPPASATTEQATPAPDLVDINRAGPAELDTLPGVGPRTAESIIEYREENGSFTRLEELMNVRGIGERTFLRLRPLVTVGAPDER